MAQPSDKTSGRTRILGLLILISSTSCSSPPGLDERPFPVPTGTFAVGVREFHWFDEARPNPFTQSEDDKRRVPVRIWYPAEPVAGAETAPYIFDPKEFHDIDWIQGGLRLRTHAVLEAPVSRTGAPFPVLLFGHGGGYPRFIGSALGEEMASHGYVVISVGHDGFNHAQQTPDGAPIDDGTLRGPEATGDLRADFLADTKFFDTVHLPLWIADCRYVLDRLAAMHGAESGFLSGALQLERVGAYGWSFGGAVSLQLLADEPRVVAAVNFDGQLFGDVDRRGTGGPFLVLRSSQIDRPSPSEDAERAAAFDELLAMIAGRFQTLLAHSTGPGQVWQIEGTRHAFFSDLLHLSGTISDTYTHRFNAGDLESSLGHELLAMTLREFFGRELLGLQSDFLENPEESFSEIEVQAKNDPGLPATQ